MPNRIGILHSGTQGNSDHKRQMDAFIQSLAAAGYVDTQNLDIAAQLWADDDPAMLGTHADTLVKTHKVDVFVAAGGSASSKAAQAATKTTSTHVVFTSVADSVSPAQNMTGICARTSELDAIRLNLLHELMPTEKQFGALVNSSRPHYSAQDKVLHAAATALGIQLDYQDINPSGGKPTTTAIDQAFKDWALRGIPAALVTADPFFNNHRKQVVDAARVNKIPAIYQWREFVDASGLMSYGPKLTDAYKLAGICVGRILDGAQPADIPIVLLTSFELVINLMTASALGIVIPGTLLARADEIIR